MSLLLKGDVCVTECVFQETRRAARANIRTHAWKWQCFYFCKFTACKRRLFPASPSFCLSRQPAWRSCGGHKEVKRKAADGQERHCTPDPGIWPLSHFYYRGITISRLPTPPWDFPQFSNSRCGGCREISIFLHAYLIEFCPSGAEMICFLLSVHLTPLRSR